MRERLVTNESNEMSLNATFSFSSDIDYMLYKLRTAMILWEHVNQGGDKKIWGGG